VTAQKYSTITQTNFITACLESNSSIMNLWLRNVMSDLIILIKGVKNEQYSVLLRACEHFCSNNTVGEHCG
jgi:hypothetical protein